MNKLFYNCLLITMNEKEEIIPNGAIYIEGKKIAAIGTTSDLLARYPQAEKEDMQGKAVLPGFINLHTHTVLSALRGLADDCNSVKAVFGWMAYINEIVTPEESYHISSNALLELVKAGSTTVMENSANMEAVAQAMKESGLRSYLAAGKIHDYDLTPIRYGQFVQKKEIGESTLKAAMQLFENWHGKEEGRMQCVIYPHANDTCSPKLLRELKRISDHYKALVTVHFAQTTREVERLRNAYHQTPAEFLIDVGLFNERLSGAHCIFIEEGDIDLMAQYGVTFINNCVINNKRGAIPHTHIALQKGVNVGLGTDNMFGDIIETLRYAISNMRIDIPDFKIPTPYQALKMATINGAKALNRSQELGSLEEGKLADLIMVDYMQPHLLPADKDNIVENLVYNGLGSDVFCNMVEGRIIYRKDQGTLWQEEEVMTTAQQTAEKIWQRLVPLVEN